MAITRCPRLNLIMLFIKEINQTRRHYSVINLAKSIHSTDHELTKKGFDYISINIARTTHSAALYVI